MQGYGCATSRYYYEVYTFHTGVCVHLLLATRHDAAYLLVFGVRSFSFFLPKAQGAPRSAAARLAKGQGSRVGGRAIV